MNSYLNEMQDMQLSDAVNHAINGVPVGQCTEAEARQAMIDRYTREIAKAVEYRGKPLQPGERVGFRLLAGRTAGTFNKKVELLRAGDPLRRFVYPK